MPCDVSKSAGTQKNSTCLPKYVFHAPCFDCDPFALGKSADSTHPKLTTDNMIDRYFRHMIKVCTLRFGFVYGTVSSGITPHIGP